MKDNPIDRTVNPVKDAIRRVKVSRPEDEGIVGAHFGITTLHVRLQNEERIAGGHVPVQNLVVHVGVDVVPRKVARLLQRPFHGCVLHTNENKAIIDVVTTAHFVCISLFNL